MRQLCIFTHAIQHVEEPPDGRKSPLYSAVIVFNVIYSMIPNNRKCAWPLRRVVFDMAYRNFEASLLLYRSYFDVCPSELALAVTVLSPHLILCKESESLLSNFRN